MEIELKIVKRFRKDRVSILESSGCIFRFFKAGKNFICVRRDGNVVLDKSWERKTNRMQKFKLKDFLGGMYIAEVKKEIKDGNFKVCNLNLVMAI